jgi:hypothetical protein
VSETLHLREIKTVMDETGMSRERVLELRRTPEPLASTNCVFLNDWMEANALEASVSLEFCRGLLEKLGPVSVRRIHDTSTGPIAGIAGGPSMAQLRSGYGPCQRCEHEGELRLVGDRWLCARDAQREERHETFRRMVKAA